MLPTIGESSESFLLFSLGGLLLAYDLTVFLLVLLLFLGGLGFILLVLRLEPILGSFVNFVPHFADDAGQVCDFGCWVFRLDFLVYLRAIEEEC